MALRTVTDTALRVQPELLGRALASPIRRVAAFGVDFLLLLLPSFVLALAAATVSLWWTDPAALRSIRAAYSGEVQDERALARELGHLAPLLVRIQAPGLPPAVALAVEEGDLQRAGELLTERTLIFNFSFGGSPQSPPPGAIRVDVERMIPQVLRAAAVFGLAALYFTFFTSRRRHATLGKRLLGLEVVRLDGESVSVWLAFERFAGYFVSVGTLGLGLLDFWRDPNRRLAHDRLSHTVVVRVG